MFSNFYCGCLWSFQNTPNLERCETNGSEFLARRCTSQLHSSTRSCAVYQPIFTSWFSASPRCMRAIHRNLSAEALQGKSNEMLMFLPLWLIGRSYIGLQMWKTPSRPNQDLGFRNQLCRQAQHSEDRCWKGAGADKLRIMQEHVRMLSK